MIRYLTVLAALLLGCASNKVFERGPLIDLLLRPAPGYKGLINQRCVAFEKGKCTRVDVVEFDLANSADRDRLISQQFLCNVGGARYGICKSKAGLCQQTVKIHKFLMIVTGREIIETSFIPVDSKYQLLIDAGTYCAAKESIIGQEMF